MSGEHKLWLADLQLQAAALGSQDSCTVVLLLTLDWPLVYATCAVVRTKERTRVSKLLGAQRSGARLTWFVKVIDLYSAHVTGASGSFLFLAIASCSSCSIDHAWQLS